MRPPLGAGSCFETGQVREGPALSSGAQLLLLLLLLLQAFLLWLVDVGLQSVEQAVQLMGGERHSFRLQHSGDPPFREGKRGALCWERVSQHSGHRNEKLLIMILELHFHQLFI